MTKAVISSNKLKCGGQSVTEFLVVLPVVLFMIMAVLSIGLYIYCRMLVFSAATQAAKFGANLYEKDSSPYNEEYRLLEIENRALSVINSGISAPEEDPTRIMVRTEDAIVESSSGDFRIGRNVIVKVTYTFAFILPLAQEIFGDSASIPISCEAKALFIDK